MASRSGWPSSDWTLEVVDSEGKSRQERVNACSEVESNEVRAQETDKRKEIRDMNGERYGEDPGTCRMRPDFMEMLPEQDVPNVVPQLSAADDTPSLEKVAGLKKIFHTLESAQGPGSEPTAPSGSDLAERSYAQPRGLHHGSVELKLKGPWKALANKAGEGGRLSTVSVPGADAVDVSVSVGRDDRCIAHPGSQGRLCWDVAGASFLLYDIITVPLHAFGSFLDFDSEALFYFHLATSVYWALDLIACFFVGYRTKTSIELSRRKIARRYLLSWFGLDFTLVSLDWFFILAGSGQNTGFMRIGKTFARSVRVFRLFRIIKLHGIIMSAMLMIQSEYARAIVTIVVQLAVIILVNHFTACGWYAISHVDGPVSNWRSAHFYDEEHNSFGYQYATSLHWSLTQFTPASMEVTPRNTYERVYSISVLLFAMVTFSSFVSSITQAMTHISKINAQRMAEDSMLRRYLQEHGISSKLVNRVWHYLHQRKMLRVGSVRTKEHDVRALQHLPKSIIAELRYESFAPVLRSHPLFLCYGKSDPGAFKQICHTAVQEQSLLAKQELFGKGKHANAQLFFVTEGLLEYGLTCKCAPWLTSEEDDEPLGMSVSFGEEDLFTGASDVLPNATRSSACPDPCRLTKCSSVTDSTRSSSCPTSCRLAQRGSSSAPSSRAGSTRSWAGSTRSVNPALTKQRTFMFGLGRDKTPQPQDSRFKSVDKIGPGQWACEAALWSERSVELCGPFVAAEKSEVLLVKTAEFMDVVAHHEVSSARVAKYAESFAESVDMMTNCRWRVCICNDYSYVEDMVYREFHVIQPQMHTGRHSNSLRLYSRMSRMRASIVIPDNMSEGFFSRVLAKLRRSPSEVSSE